MKLATRKLFYKILTGGFILLGLLLYVNLPAAVSEIPVPGDGLIRLHVLANSDSEADQALKHKVRDEIIRVMAPEFMAAGDIDSARQIARNNLNRIETIANHVIQEEGKNYPVTAKLDTFPFPTKHYGAFILPAGDYEAVRVVIGSGEGTNWWCVLFPPLCFVDMSRNIATDTTLISFTSTNLTPDLAADGQPAEALHAKTDTAINNKPEICLSNKQELGNQRTTAVEDANEKAVSTMDKKDKVIFSFRLVEWIKSL